MRGPAAGRASRRPTSLPRGLALLLAAVVGVAAPAVTVVATATPAAAHAVPVSTSPVDGARLEAAPSEVRVEFNEPVSADLGGLRVLDRDGNRVDEGAVRAEGTIVEVDLRAGLGEGSYVASWRVVSVDGHPIRGGIVFSVGDADPEADRAALSGAFDEGGDRAWRVAGGIGRWLAYTGVLVAAGGAALLLAIRAGGHPARSRRWVAGFAAAGAVGVVAALPIQAARATGQGAGAIFQDGVARGVLGDGVGLATVLALAGLAVLAAGLRWSLPAAVAGGALAAGSFAATGHNRSSDVAALATTAGVVHLWAAAVWLGGIVVLWLAVRAWRRRPELGAAELAGAVGRFSTMATAAVLAVTVAGLTLAWSEVRTVEGLTSTDYGALLFAKLGVVSLVVAAAIYNNRVLVPAVAAGRHRGAAPRLARTLGVEGGALLVAVGITAVLVQVTPARSAVDTAAPVERIVELGDAGTVQLIVDPPRTGPITVHLYAYDPDGFPADIAEDLVLELRLPEADLGPLERQPYRAGPAHHQLDGSTFPTSGTWEVTVRARIDRFTEATGTVEVPVSG